MQMPQRRSRMRRTRTGKRIELTSRDIEIFKLLDRYRYLRSTYLHAFVGGASRTRFKERLGDLFHEGYLDRPEQQWQFANARYEPAVYEIGQGALRALRATGEVTGNQFTFLGKAVHHQFQHSLMICQILASLDLGVRAVPGLRFIAWPEIVGRAPEATRSSGTPFRLPLPSGGYLVPDGLFGLQYCQGARPLYRFFAVEADRGTMPLLRTNSRQSSLIGKIETYRAAYAAGRHRTNWGVPNLLVLVVTTEEARARGLLTACTSTDPAVLCRSVFIQDLTVPCPTLLTEPWDRVAGTPLLLATL